MSSLMWEHSLQSLLSQHSCFIDSNFLDDCKELGEYKAIVKANYREVAKLHFCSEHLQRLCAQSSSFGTIV